MKHLKLFEDWGSEIKRGDYVLLDTTKMNLMNSTASEKKIFDGFISNNIGTVNDLDMHLNTITIKYYNIITEIKHFFNYDDTLFISPKYIKYFDSDPKNIKIKIEGEQYNL